MKAVKLSLLRYVGVFVLGAVLSSCYYNIFSTNPAPADISSSKRGCVCTCDSCESRDSGHVPSALQRLEVYSEPPDNQTQLNQFLHPSGERSPILTAHDMKRRGFNSKVYKEVRLLRQEYHMRSGLLVGVLTQQDYLPTRAKALYDTWGREVDKLVFFVGEDCVVSQELSYLPIVKLQGIPDRVYPPLLKAFAAIKYMYENFINEFNWFVRADDDMYLRPDKLSSLLHKLPAHEHVYMGLAGAGRVEDLERLQLLAHERYCMGGPGIFMSMHTLENIGPHLDNCLRAVMYHDDFNKADWNDDDVEIGRCISRKVGVQCSTSKESRKYFRFDYSGATLDPATFWSEREVQELITVHPVKDPNGMYALHHFFKTLNFQDSYRKLQAMVDSLNNLCSTLPPHSAPPNAISPSCDLKLHPHLEYINDQGARFNHLGNAPAMYFSQVDSIPFIYRAKNKFDLLPWIRFNNSHVQDVTSLFQQHPIYHQLHSELTSVLNTLHDYLNVESKGSISNLLDGYVRYHPLVGREYMFSVRISKQTYKNFRLTRGLSALVTVTENEINTSQPTVHVILPLENIDKPFEEFLKNYAQFGLRYKENKLHLIIVISSEHQQEQVKSVIRRVTMKTFQALVTIVTSDGGKFNRLRGIEDGVASLQGSNSLMFLADVNVRFGPGFFRRCRTNTILNHQVYFPTAFWLYNSEQETQVFNETVPQLGSWSGEWVKFNFWLVCTYKEDYVRVGGYGNTKFSVTLFERFSKSHLEVVQAPEPGLFHLWGKRTCKDMTSHSRRKVCEGLKYRGHRDHAEMADYVSEMLSGYEAGMLDLPRG